MTLLLFAACLLGMIGMGYVLGLQRALVVAGVARRQMHSPPEHHGVLVALCAGIPALGVLLVGSFVPLPLGSLGLAAAALVVGGVGAWLGRRSIAPALRAR